MNDKTLYEQVLKINGLKRSHLAGEPMKRFAILPSSVSRQSQMSHGIDPRWLTSLTTIRIAAGLILLITALDSKEVGAQVSALGVTAPSARPTGSAGPSGSSGGSSRSSTESAPSAAEIAAQQAATLNDQGNAAYARKEWAAAEALYKEALTLGPEDHVILGNLGNTQIWEGEDAYRRGDYTKALNYFQQAAANRADYPASQILVADLAAAQDKLDQAHRELEQRRKDKITANNMRQAIHDFARTTLSAAPSSGGLKFSDGKAGLPATPGSGDDNSGLEFMPFKDAVADSRSDQKVARGSFGDNVAKPDDLTPADWPATPGPDIKPADQLESTLFHGLQAASDANPDLAKTDSSKGFDKAGDYKGHLDVPAVQAPQFAPEDFTIPGEMLTDPAVLKLNDYKQQAKKSHEVAASAQAEFEAELRQDSHSDQLVLLLATAREAQDMAAYQDQMIRVQTGEVKRKISFAKINTGGDGKSTH